eukprot:7407668-Lingulodinium_polyedra.AAC.1
MPGNVADQSRETARAARQYALDLAPGPQDLAEHDQRNPCPRQSGDDQHFTLPRTLSPSRARTPN